MKRTTTALVAGLTLSVAGGSAVVVGFAAGLGGVDGGSLQSWSTQLAVSAPTVVECDNFDEIDGDLQGRSVSSVDTCGTSQWSVHGGTWVVGGSVVAADGTAGANATLPSALSDATVAAQVLGADTGGAAGGVALGHDGVASFLAATLVGDAVPHVDLLLVAGGAPVTLTSAPLTIAATTMLSLTRVGADVTVAIDGTTVLSYTLLAGDIAALGSGTRAGLYTSSSSIQFDNLRVTTPSPS
jgi:hypothetical protein